MDDIWRRDKDEAKPVMRLTSTAVLNPLHVVLESHSSDTEPHLGRQRIVEGKENRLEITPKSLSRKPDKCLNFSPSL